MFCPHIEFMFYVWISEQTEIFPYTSLSDWFYNIVITLYRPVVTICSTSLTFNNSTFCPHSEVMCFVWISEQTELFSYTTLSDRFYNIDLTLYIPVVTICNTSITFNYSTFCLYSEYICVVGISEQTEIFHYTALNVWLYNIDLTLYIPVVTICTTSLTLNIPLFLPIQWIFCFVWVSEQTEIFPYTTLCDLIYNIDLTLYSPVATICTISLTFNNSTFCPHSEYMFFVWISEQS